MRRARRARIAWHSRRPLASQQNTSGDLAATAKKGRSRRLTRSMARMTAPRIRSRPLAAKKAVPRIRSRPLAAKLTSTTERRFRNRFLEGEAPRIRSWPLAAKRVVPRIRGRPLAAKQTSTLRSLQYAGPERTTRAYRLPVAPETASIAAGHKGDCDGFWMNIDAFPLAIDLGPEGAARAHRLPDHLRPRSASR